MSRLYSQSFSCGGCGAALEMGIVASINADRRPDLRQAVLDDSYQRGRCEACGKDFRVQPDLTYVDAGRGQWILVRPAERLAEWAPTEELAQQAFERGYGEEAAVDARELGAAMQSRLAFGWAAFREKLLCAEHGLDDVALELTKLAVMRAVEDMPLGDDMELRLTAATTDALELTWALSGGDLALESIAVPRKLYDEIAKDKGKGWVEARAELSGGAYVDVNRILVPAEEEA
ncbi:CpXC domain-containing protein [Roseateles sp. NT4]|uniref:CpXC domain-containing protein n=1 Tax=Roseateles sp. NT4 TaxID=3453715 RepID=UPI003EEB8848